MKKKHYGEYPYSYTGAINFIINRLSVELKNLSPDSWEHSENLSLQRKLGEVIPPLKKYASVVSFQKKMKDIKGEKC